MTSRKLVSRWRPPGFSGGSKSLISFHCLFVRSVGYLFLRIQCPYRLDGQVVKLSCSKQVQRFCSQLLIRNFSNSFLESRELQRYINRTLATLPRVWRRAFTLHYVGGVTVAEIARMTKGAESEVERHLEYAREYLRQRLREDGFEAPTHDQAALTTF